MTSSQGDLLKLLALVFLMLGVATVIGKILSKKSSISNAAVINNLNARINAWWVMVVLMGIAFMGGKAGVIILFGVCSFAALREFVLLTQTKLEDSWALSVAFFVVLPVQYVFIWYEWYGLYSIFIPVYAFLLLPMVDSLIDWIRFCSQPRCFSTWSVMVGIYHDSTRF
jgi:phosphatidate cytidylyltransferase